eukprot:TRINITY_DN3074_c0_g1_i3.p1 TRINITY_DN3074_c0_g1~~TRINITY_DN3074_c0_g1_i3.p1  ORF type:complete len:328 (+),score=50.14 TRINITY_DN3074_c0_g1_i3:132-1115(+)
MDRRATASPICSRWVHLPLRVPPSQALVDIIRFIWQFGDAEVLSLQIAGQGAHNLSFVAFPDYVMISMEIQIYDGWVVCKDLSSEDTDRFHDFVHDVASSCTAIYKKTVPERVNGPIDDIEHPRDEESTIDLSSRSRLLVRQVTGMQGSSWDVQIEAARTLARWAKDPCRRVLIGSEIAQESEAVSKFLATSLSASRNLTTLQAIYPFLAALKSIAACPAGASLLLFLQQLRGLVCLTDCSLLMRTFRQLLGQVAQAKSLLPFELVRSHTSGIDQEVLEKQERLSVNLMPASDRTYTSSTECCSVHGSLLKDADWLSTAAARVVCMS